ncbi:MAG: hypothetical protein GY769_03915 [bacterium]|nr:hypothetical protein [bacterium]
MGESASGDSRTSGPLLGRNSGVAFVFRASLWVLALFAVVRIPWVQVNVLLPFSGLQGRIACTLAGTEPSSVFVGLSCTGADPMALVLGAILAFPVRWRRRILGCALGLGIILLLNLVRIGSLSMVADQGDVFSFLHIYLWPALLIAVAAGYVFIWMGSSLRSQEGTSIPPEERSSFPPQNTLQFLGVLCLFVLLFFLLAPWLMRSTVVLEIARWSTLVAAAFMKTLGVEVEVADNLLTTPHGAWLVTPACVVTPLLPVYLAAALFLPVSSGQKALASLAALPLFVFLGSARLLILAIPATIVGSYAIAIHAFYQVLTAAAIVIWTAYRLPAEQGSSSKSLLAIRALVTGTTAGVVVGVLGRVWLWPAAQRLESFHLGHTYTDVQGVVSLMPAFQFALFAAMWVALVRPFRDHRLALGVGILALLQGGEVILLGELAIHTGVELPIAAIRAMSIAVPLLLIWFTARPRIGRAVDSAAESVAVRQQASGESSSKSS